MVYLKAISPTIESNYDTWYRCFLERYFVIQMENYDTDGELYSIGIRME